MKEYSKEELTGLCEAYQLYCILPEEDKKKIPEDLVKEMKKSSKYNLGAIINAPSDIEANRLSKEGVKLMAYMCLFLK